MDNAEKYKTKNILSIETSNKQMLNVQFWNVIYIFFIYNFCNFVTWKGRCKWSYGEKKMKLLMLNTIYFININGDGF